MNDARHHWVLAGGLWLASTGLAALAQDRVPPTSTPSRPGRSSATPLESLAAEPNDLEEAIECPPRPPGPLVRWHRRCKARAQEKYWGYPEEFQDAPLGAMLQAHVDTSIANGQAARMVLRQYDFYPFTNQLKPRGKSQLAKIASWLLANPSPVFVEPSVDDPGLNEARRRTVARELAVLACPVPGERILVGLPGGGGVSGVESILIDRNRLNQTTTRGAGAGGSGDSNGSSNGGGGAGTSSSSSGSTSGK